MKSHTGRAVRPSSSAKHRAMLAAAEEAFLAARYDTVTVDEIAAASGVSKQTVYAHFGTKDRLFVQLVDAITRQAAEQVAAVPHLPRTRAEMGPALEDLLGRQLDTVLTPRLLQLRRLVISEAGRFPDLARAVYDQGPARAVRLLEDVLQHLADRGWIQTDDLHSAAEHLNWLVMGGPTNAAMFLGDRAGPDPDERPPHVARAVAAFLAAYAT